MTRSSRKAAEELSAGSSPNVKQDRFLKEMLNNHVRRLYRIRVLQIVRLQKCKKTAHKKARRPARLL
ncbi:MAG: hypothetical protein II474_06785, partial [Firmicutes bacterium]|nr:hypothetical protein [Bacillota bacterium]